MSAIHTAKWIVRADCMPPNSVSRNGKPVVTAGDIVDTGEAGKRQQEDDHERVGDLLQRAVRRAGIAPDREANVAPHVLAEARGRQITSGGHDAASKVPAQDTCREVGKPRKGEQPGREEVQAAPPCIFVEQGKRAACRHG